MILWPHLYIFTYEEGNFSKNKYLILMCWFCCCSTNERRLASVIQITLFCWCFFKVYLEVLKLNSIKKELKAKIGLLGMYAVQQLIISSDALIYEPISAPLAVKSLMGLQSTYVFTKQLSIGGYTSKQEWLRRGHLKESIDEILFLTSWHILPEH